DAEDRERGRAHPDQAPDWPPDAATASALRWSAAGIVSHAFAQLVMKKFFISHGSTREVLLQKRSKFPGIAFLRFRRRLIRQRSFELSQLGASEFAVDPRGPFFFKRFHRGPSGGSAIFSGRTKVATSRC